MPQALHNNPEEDGFVARSIRITHAELFQLLRRAGYGTEVIDEIAAQLPDPIDVDRDSRILEIYGVTCEGLMDRMGASP